MLFKQFNKKERLYIYQFLIDMIDSDLPIYDSLLTLVNKGESLLGKTFVIKVKHILKDMANSSNLASCFEGVIPANDLSIFHAADRAGDIKGGLIALIQLNEFRSKCISTLVSSLTFPLIMVIITFVVIAGYSVSVFPAFIPVVPVEKWPTSTAMLYGTGLWIYNGGWLVLILSFLSISVLFTILLNRFTGSVRELFSNVFPFSMYRQFVMTDFLVALYLLLHSGVPYIDALNLIRENSNRYLKWHLTKVISNLNAGLGYGEAMRTGLLDKVTVFDFAIYSELPSFVNTLQQISMKSQTNLLTTFNTMAGILKNSATAFLGGVIIWVFIGLFALIDVLSEGI
ncbi:hypothetical protein HWQ46_05150 [Shewanella sp. D64]|uniref:hypothetical protein n=1 Tax=unclassified Shewanella TaxID=196818 RepID=UPI0022BA30DB|nr:MULTISPECIES: hypothetical protein [unclassified Shewanella]MEC4724938.1 hypothetical protein [Shewanella sp. D64]MEC4736269.1 hypothetical protein [Shewanella sp. E94]WBJ97667.1 hypothetical protein HWQ47_11520 [Shewanella sp. MTB7]